jgi:DNA-binding LacI/PurR family transcriptional regulator
MAHRTTLAEVAARAGVSVSTASLVIRDAPGPSAASRDRVRRAAADLGYTPDPTAQLLRRRRSRLLGVVFSARDPFHADLLDAVYPAAEELRYDVVLSAVGPTRTEDRALDALLGSRCEALVRLGPTADAERLTRLAERLPVVVVGAPVPGAGVDILRTADDEGTRLAVDHLVALGHRSIVHVDGGEHAAAVDRRRGYRAAVGHHGLAAQVLLGDETEVSGARAVRALLAGGELPTAVLAYNDRCAVGVLDELRRHGIGVPERVSVVGYDDSALAGLAHVDLTTVRQDAERMARLAVRTAVERLDGVRDEPRTALLEPQLVVRGSTAPAAQ